MYSSALIAYFYHSIQGSYDCDTTLRANGFNGEYVTGPSVLAVKMHYSEPPKTRQCFGEHCFTSTPAIILIRNPRGALIAEWNRIRGNGHTALASFQDFGKCVCEQ